MDAIYDQTQTIPSRRQLTSPSQFPSLCAIPRNSFQGFAQGVPHARRLLTPQKGGDQRLLKLDLTWPDLSEPEKWPFPTNQKTSSPVRKPFVKIAGTGSTLLRKQNANGEGVRPPGGLVTAPPLGPGWAGGSSPAGVRIPRIAAAPPPLLFPKKRWLTARSRPAERGSWVEKRTRGGGGAGPNHNMLLVVRWKGRGTSQLFHLID